MMGYELNDISSDATWKGRHGALSAFLCLWMCINMHIYTTNTCMLHM